ncbi:hypothetical protein [uncultured Sphaerochaeta sp.]|uniref:hypothetical protein n=1 Tax=uncultured Sphaerochaeta sp. TaxID=886478 RepID=UPI002A0A4664|nr:hypothetical protein [uncultured Sphaerochaeta sp.]
MKKYLTTFIVFLFCIPALFAGTFDLGITLGTNAHFYENNQDNDMVKLAWGATFGITDVLEFDIQANSQLVPQFFGSTNVAVLVQRTIQGERNTGKKVAGIGLNSLLGVGVMFTDYQQTGILLPTHLLVSCTPYTLGSPYSGKRERLLSLTLAYNMYTNQVSLMFDLIKYDYYAIGSYRDWE